MHIEGTGQSVRIVEVNLNIFLHFGRTGRVLKIYKSNNGKLTENQDTVLRVNKFYR